MERYFALTDSDIAAVNERFPRDRRAGAAIQLVFLRASDHTLDDVGTLPRQVLRYVGERLGLPTPTIASLRTLYHRYKTLYEHQVSGQLRSFDAAAEIVNNSDQPHRKLMVNEWCVACLLGRSCLREGMNGGIGRQPVDCHSDVIDVPVTCPP